MRVVRYILVFVVALFALAGCKKDEPVSGDYGWVQFRVFKSGSFDENTRAATTRTTTGDTNDRLDSLWQAQKIRLTLTTADGSATINQTVVMLAHNASMAELGMQSDKFQLLAGNYILTGFNLYDGYDESVYAADLSGNPVQITITSGGLTLKDIAINTLEKGRVKFRLKKVNLGEITPPITRAGETPITGAFHTIKAFDVTVRSNYWVQERTFVKLPVVHEYPFVDDTAYITGYGVSDSLCEGLRGGQWSVTAVKIYYDNISYTKFDELTVVPANSFTVYDNGITQVDVPVTLTNTAEDIKDALALRAIWEALDGPNWRVKWDFDRDIDLWIDQPGVSTIANGRVAVIDLSDVGAKGVIPADIGQLTELRQLYLGTHAWTTSGSNLNPPLSGRRGGALYDPTKRWDVAKDFREMFIDNGEPYHKFESDVIRQSLPYFIKNPKTKGAELRVLPLAAPMTNPFNYSNMITGIDPAINNCVNLESLYIAYSAMESLPADLSGLTNLVDMELFACPKLTEVPAGLATLPNLGVLIVSGNGGITPAKMRDGLAMLNGGVVAENLQALQISGQPITTIPSLRNMKRLGQFDFQNCGATAFEDHFDGHILRIINASYNKLSALPRDGDGMFIGVDGEIEAFYFANNEFTELPDVFDAKSIYTIETIDFSNNKITGYENGNADPDLATCRGMNVKYLRLNNNKIQRFPKEILHKGSTVGNIEIRGNEMEELDDDTFDVLKGAKSPFLQVLDLSYNRLDNLGKSFNGENLSFLYTGELSGNRFKEIPRMLNSISSLTVLGFRNQTDGQGNKIMRSWPQGIATHKGLRALFFGNNDIRGNIGSTDGEMYRISYMWGIFEIMGNDNIGSINLVEVCDRIRGGMMDFRYDPTQNIINCPGLFVEKR